MLVVAGDCGGPLLIPHMPEGVIKAGDPKRDWVVGIKTYGIIECDGKNPDVYTRIAPFWGWISGIIEKVTNLNRHTPPRWMRFFVAG